MLIRYTSTYVPGPRIFMLPPLRSDGSIGTDQKLDNSHMITRQFAGPPSGDVAKALQIARPYIWLST